MPSKPKWLFDETKHAGVDYNDPAQVQVYDARHQEFRNYEKDSEAIIERIKLEPHQTLIDLGTGTGAFALHAARRCKKVYAVDVSKPMLEWASRKAEKAGIDNIDFLHGGFLTYEHNEEPADAIVSVFALHHLPDFWKLTGLRRAAAMLKSGGKFYLFDVVFSFDPADYESHLNNWVRSLRADAGPEMAEETEEHIRNEYSTFSWIMEELLEKSGFTIERAEYQDVYLAWYLCVKNKG
ncbi:MAG: class I SAM-dependent methyltransferase [Deltaproteobacteria bacterium]|nr:class I SAM-dependent methyltransferase [Deltaproteobacteria bacterium]